MSLCTKKKKKNEQKTTTKQKQKTFKQQLQKNANMKYNERDSLTSRHKLIK